jgi:ketosteroid isomerase-like protein
MWSEIAVEVDEIRPVRPGRVVLLGRLVGTSRDTGLEAAAPCGWVFELRDGMITSARTYPDPDEAIRAAEA